MGFSNKEMVIAATDGEPTWQTGYGWPSGVQRCAQLRLAKTSSTRRCPSLDGGAESNNTLDLVNATKNEEQTAEIVRAK